MMKKLSLFCVLMISVLSNGIFAQAEQIIGVMDTNGFIPPLKLEMPFPEYPVEALDESEEGWVELSFMVDTDGNAFEPVVVDSVGRNDFNLEAIKAIQISKFQPASLNGEPVISSASHKYTYSMMWGPKSAHTIFVTRYRKFSMAYYKDDSQKKLQGLLGKLIERGAKNHYENAFLNWAQYMYSIKFGEPLESLKYLRAAIKLEELPDIGIYLPFETVQVARRELFQLEASNYRLGEAEAAYQMLEQVNDKEAVDLFKDTYNALRSYQDNDQSYSAKFILNESGKDFIQLYKHKFYLAEIDGQVDDVKLRCEQKFITLSVEADTSYEIPDAYGKCSIEFLGSPESSFLLVQH